MCGIVGFTGKKDLPLLLAMKQAVAHRGPDSQGQYVDNQINLGHQRLAIIDLSDRAVQPMFNENKSVVLVGNGEIYNFKSLRQKLAGKGHKFVSQSDTEVLVHGYEEWGLNQLLAKLQGCFAFALWDKAKQNLFLVRDRIGIKPLYWAKTDKRFIFASEIKAMAQDKSIKPKVNQKSFWQYLSWQASLGDDTMWQQIKKVPPATILTYHKGKIKQQKYWQTSIVTNKKQDGSELKERLLQLATQAVNTRLQSDVPVGVLLSGGLDSSAIVALSQKKLNTFAVGFGQSNDELKHARLIADYFGTKHHELLIKARQIKKLLPQIAYQQDEPLADGGGIATYLAAQAVAKKVKVVLSGEGGDEAFGGYNWYQLGVKPFVWLPRAWRQKIYYYLTTFNPPAGLKPKLKQTQDMSFLQSMQCFEIKHILPNSLCMKLDKMTASWGLEARTPWLDYQLLEFCLSLPDEDKVSWHQSKILLRQALKDKLPPAILARRKQGWLLPTVKWLNYDLKDWVRQVVLDKNAWISQHFSVKQREKLFIKRPVPWEYGRINLLWRLLMFELWFSAYNHSK